MKQLFANNAKTTLANPISATDTAMVVTDGSLFPVPGTFEYFLVTLEVGGQIEIVMITGRTGNTFTIGGLLDIGQSVAGRGQEGTNAQAFTAGARVEGRITKNTLGRLSTNLASLSSFDLLVSPKNSWNSGFVVSSYDPAGNPAVVVAKDIHTWRFLNYTSQMSATVTSATLTSATASSIVLSNFAANKYIVQFTSGALIGQVRQIVTNAANQITWTTATTTNASAGDTFEILEAQVSIISDFANINTGTPIAVNSGTVDAITATYSPAIASLSNNLVVEVVLSGPNTSTVPTFSPNGLTARTIVSFDGTPLNIGQINGTILLRYDTATTKWWLISGGASVNTVSIQSLSFYLGNL